MSHTSAPEGRLANMAGYCEMGAAVLMGGNCSDGAILSLRGMENGHDKDEGRASGIGDLDSASEGVLVRKSEHKRAQVSKSEGPTSDCTGKGSTDCVS